VIHPSTLDRHENIRTIFGDQSFVVLLLGFRELLLYCVMSGSSILGIFSGLHCFSGGGGVTFTLECVRVVGRWGLPSSELHEKTDLPSFATEVNM